MSTRCRQARAAAWSHRPSARSSMTASWPTDTRMSVSAAPHVHSGGEGCCAQCALETACRAEEGKERAGEFCTEVAGAVQGAADVSCDKRELQLERARLGESRPLPRRFRGLGSSHLTSERESDFASLLAAQFRSPRTLLSIRSRGKKLSRDGAPCALRPLLVLLNAATAAPPSGPALP